MIKCCEWCGNKTELDTYKNTQLAEGAFCSLECETAMLIGVDLFFMGSSAELIPHLRDIHCMTKDQIKIGIDKIFQGGDDILKGALIDWEDHF